VGGSVGAELPGFLWRFGGWTACVALVILVQGMTILVTSLFWSRPIGSYPTGRIAVR
jgi:hypothetical protein